MSQRELGAALGVTFQQVQKYERGANRISASKLQTMAVKLNIPIAYFFDEIPSKKVQSDGFEAVTEFLDIADGLALLKAFERIKHKALRRAVVRLVEQMAREH